MNYTSNNNNNNNDNNTQNGNNDTPSVEEAFRGLDISNVQVIM